VVDRVADLAQLDLQEPVAATAMSSSQSLELVDQVDGLDANRPVLRRRARAARCTARLALAQASGL